MESDFLAIIFSAVLSLGGVWALISGFDDDDNDQDGGGTASPVLTPYFSGSTAWIFLMRALLRICTALLSIKRSLRKIKEII